MTKITSAGTCTAIVAAATISLMAQPPTPPETTTSPSTAHRITVTGCLKPALAPTDSTAATGTTGTTGAAGTTATATAPEATDAAKFVLADAKVSPATGDTTTTETAPAGATSSGTASKGAAQTYRLIANPAALTPHVGKKLELTGTLVDESASPSSTTAEQSAAGSGPMLKVEAGKVLAASCQN